ncbi:lytic transglycosylase domain-containing protein [Hydrogenophaga sp. PAMC20947]|uniref:lytic transglycosylase domain-containing protein n=1 Tax=Hydrogenophaga sp. PAMC20947 TaxID=2565558 RepID=UPI001444BA83|nr:lytic transglycosylase domain-containing protein [Hydrogenophaga sp. PAMC20947]
MRTSWGATWRRSAVALALLLCAPAWAQIWGYVDRGGATHFSDHRVDNRYELFYKGIADSSPVAGGQRSAAWARPGVGAAFDVSTRYKAVRYLIREAATAYGVEYELLKAVIATESGFNPRAVSPMGAVGLMQLMPETAQRFGVKAQARQSVEQRLTDPRTNVHAGARYLAWLMKRFDGEIELALAAYNAGEGAVRRAGRQVPNYRETQDYVAKVMRLHQDLRPPKAVLRQRADAREAIARKEAVPVAAL